DPERDGHQPLLRRSPHAARGRRVGGRQPRCSARGAGRGAGGARMISRDTPVARLLDEHPELLEVLASYHSPFTMLRNKGLPRIMAPRVTLAQAARIAGVPTDDLLSVLQRAVGEISLHQDSRSSRSSDAGEPPTPSAETEPYRRFTDVPEA